MAEILAEAYPPRYRPGSGIGFAGLSGAGVHDFSHMGAADIFSMFNDIFGGALGGGRRRGREGADLPTAAELTLGEGPTGADRSI